ncbi:hypothetical protein CASFOL_037105 [Castilleja foliolosa]|uniref:Uncharacterized protein n=1 Tax=Castilleja foliolosa TaxID=1961234 RepID=A0ABD3BNM7_9LAMI
MRRENELLEQRLMREMREIEERASRKSDDLRSEMREIEERASRNPDDLRSDIEKLKKTVEELQRHNNYVPFEEDYLVFEPSSSSPTGQTLQPPLVQITPKPPPKTITPPPPPTKKKQRKQKRKKKAQTKAQTTERKTPPPPAEEDDPYVPFDGNFIDDIEAFADKADFVRCRGDGEPESTPIRRLPVPIGKYLIPIKASRAVVKKQQAKTPLLTIRRAIRPPKDSDAKTYIIDRTCKHMSSYIAYLESDSKEALACFHMKMPHISKKLKILTRGWIYRNFEVDF